MRIGRIKGRLLRYRWLRLAGEEGGFSTVELLVVAAMLPVVLMAVLKPLDTASKLSPRAVEYTHAVTDGRVGLQQMVREIRQAYQILGTTPNSIWFRTAINGDDEQIFYECDEPYPASRSNPYASSYHRCLRVAAPSSGSLPSIAGGAVVVDRLVNGTSTDPVFTFTPDGITPTYVEAQVKLPARGELAVGLTHTITLDDGAYLRNNALG